MLGKNVEISSQIAKAEILHSLYKNCVPMVGKDMTASLCFGETEHLSMNHIDIYEAVRAVVLTCLYKDWFTWILFV